MPTGVLPYTDPFGNGTRPYLALHVTGINGTSGRIVGLLDTGADTTLLPLGYASLMGYGPQTLTAATVGTAGAPADAHRADVPCAAQVVGIGDVALELHPVFVASAPRCGGAATLCACSASSSTKQDSGLSSTGEADPASSDKVLGPVAPDPGYKDPTPVGRWVRWGCDDEGRPSRASTASESELIGCSSQGPFERFVAPLGF